jgi:hypothetical protein
MATQLDVGSPLWWVRRLETQLDAGMADKTKFSDYYEGQQKLAFATAKFKSAFGDLFAAFSDNWCDLIVDAVEERLNIEGFHLGGDKVGDKKAWQFWQANHLDADSQLAHNEALVHGEGYVIVWAGDDDKVPLITVESALQCAVAYVAGNPRARAAAIKRWVDDDNFEMLTLYMPDAIFKYRSRTKLASNGYRSEANPARWVERPAGNELWPLNNPLGVVPMVPIVNRPRLLKPGVSEIKRVVPLQDAVNKMVADMLVASEFGAAPQRWATGLDVPRDPETNKPLAPFEHMIDRLWTAKDAATKFGQFSQTDLTIFVKAVEMLVQHIASQTRTPPHYFALTGQFPSGDAIKSAETGLVAKCRRKMVHFGEAWEEVLSLGFAVIGDRKRAAIKESEIVWGDPESRSEGQHVDATVKLKILDVPNEMLWKKAGFSMSEIETMKAMIAALPPAEKVPVLAEAIRA